MSIARPCLTTTTDDLVHPIAPADEPAVLALNNAHTVELSWLDTEKLSRLLAQAFHARRIGAVDAFVIAFDQAADYDSPNYLWFRARYRRFVYVDRVVVTQAARGRGYARRLYADLFDRARRDGHDRVACEVNADPPNPVSDAFHARLGFVRVGGGSAQGKTVTYLVRDIGAAGAGGEA